MTRAQHSGHAARPHSAAGERPKVTKAPKGGVVWKLSWAARFVAKWEGWLSTAYLDTIASPPVWTQGYGDTEHVERDRTWSKAKGIAVLTQDLRTAARAVKGAIHVKLTARQRIALISLAFNCGPGAVEGSTLQRKLNAGDYLGAANEFLEWSHAGGAVVQGLLNRRRDERWMFLHDGKDHR